MSDNAKLVLSKYLLGDGTWPGHKFGSKYPNQIGAVAHVFYVLRPNGSVWGAKSNFGKHVSVDSLCGRYTRQIDALLKRPRETYRLCKNCLRVAGSRTQ